MRPTDELPAGTHHYRSAPRGRRASTGLTRHQCRSAPCHERRTAFVTAATVAETDPEAAFATAYDAARKACSALLEVQGLRATSRGGHIAVWEAVTAQLADLSGGEVFKPLHRLRRRRNDIEYPSDTSPVDSDEVQDALDNARRMVDFAAKLTDHLPVY